MRLVESADHAPGIADMLWSEIEGLKNLAPSPSGMVETWRGLAAVIPIRNGGDALIGVVRQDNAPPFAASQREAFGLLIPHMARTLRFQRMLSSSREEGCLTPLPRRQCEVLTLGAQGLRSKEIAARMGLSVRTVEHHFTAAAQRLKTRGRSQTIATAIELGLITP
jgi:DNA-binding CsgD family transcriptional regulator